MAPNDTKKRWTSYLTAGAVGFVAALVLCWAWQGMSSQKLAISFPGGLALDLQAEGDQISHVDMLEQMYAEQFSRAGLLGWLREKSIYQISDREIAAALPGLCEEMSPQDPLQERLRKQQACAQIDVISDLRALASDRDVPFHYVGQEVRIGVPSEDDQPAPRRANACSGGGWHGQDVELTNPLNERQITIFASGSYRCTGVIGTPDLQLNEADALGFFDGALDKYEEAVAVIIE